MNNLEKLIASYLEQAQSSEDAVADLTNKSGVAGSIASMEGVQLDNIGTLVGEPRTTSDDTQYRLRILARISVNVSRGTIEDVISAINAFTTAFQGTPSVVHLEEFFPATLYVDAGFVSPSIDDSKKVGSAVGAAAAAGVGVYFKYDTSDNPFTLKAGTTTGPGPHAPVIDPLTGLGALPVSFYGPGGELSGVVFS